MQQLQRNTEAAAAQTPEAKAVQAFRAAVAGLPAAHDLVRAAFGASGPCVRTVQEVRVQQRVGGAGRAARLHVA